jgi:hypothetical protein
MNTISPGEKYRHFKGNEYKIICVGKNSETEEDMVVYCDSNNPEKIWIRPLAMFLDMKKNEEGIEVERFKKI